MSKKKHPMLRWGKKFTNLTAHDLTILCNPGTQKTSTIDDLVGTPAARAMEAFAACNDQLPDWRGQLREHIDNTKPRNPIWANLDPRFHGMTAEQVFNLLEDEDVEARLAANKVSIFDEQGHAPLKVQKKLLKLLTKKAAKKARRKAYADTWGTPVGKDCVSLCYSLPRFLSQRLIFLGTHTQGYPMSYIPPTRDAVTEGMSILETAAYTEEQGYDEEAVSEAWKGDLLTHGRALLRYADSQENDAPSTTCVEDAILYRDAQDAMRWVTDHLGELWD